MYNINLLGANPPEPREIIKFLKTWWINHILKSDADYENYKNKIKSDVNYSEVVFR
jgi:hemerythrin